MKKIISLLISVIMLFSALAFSADAAPRVGLSLCVTWILKPVRYTYYAEYYSQGETVHAPDIEDPTYENDFYYYEFLGWKLLKDADAVNDYYDYQPGLAINETYVPEEFPVVEKEELIFGAVYRLIPKKYDIDGNRTITISDITKMINHLSFRSPDEPLLFDLDSNGIADIKDVSAELNYLAMGVEIYNLMDASTGKPTMMYSGGSVYSVEQGDDFGQVRYSFDGKYVYEGLMNNMSTPIYFFNGTYVYAYEENIGTDSAVLFAVVGKEIKSVESYQIKYDKNRTGRLVVTATLGDTLYTIA